MSTYKPIQHIIVPSTGSFIFSNIPQNYTDLVLVVNGLASSPTATGLRFNGDTSSSYSATYLDGTTAASSYRETNANTGWGGSYYSDRPSSVVINIMNYANTNTNKTFITRYGSGKTIVNITAGLWRKTEAINSINVYTGATFNTTTTATLYGIESALSEQAKATGGNSIYRDSSYWYHIFTSSGTFTPSESLSNVDYLVVAGGGGGGISAGGGGGGGGVRSTISSTGGGGSVESKLSLSATSYAVTVGAGGSASAPGVQAGQGGNSTFATITSTGGGKGGAGGAGGNGGSGGGGEWQSAKGLGTANQGYDGSNGSQSGPPYKGGGGGGAGQTGSMPNGGNGITNSITGSSLSFGGGGGGGSTDSNNGSGGSGGGGAGSAGSGAPAAGTVNTGGGAGGSGSANVTAAGGSGIVIVRYPV